jgi:hypothetical protein
VFDFNDYCLDTYAFILETWPWVRVSETIHRMLAHSAEVIVINGNRGLLRMGEHGNESMHSVQRKTRDFGARKSNLVRGDTDTFR